MRLVRLVFVATCLFVASAVVSAAKSETDIKEIASEALAETLGKSNPDVVDTYFSADYIQHNPEVPNGSDSLKELISILGKSGYVKADFVRVISDGDLVAFHGRYEGFGPKPMISFDVFRVEDGNMVEHWDNLIEEQPLNPSGHSQIDGATEITDLDQTDENKDKVLDFITQSLIEHKQIDITQYISPETYIQHNLKQV